MLNLPTALPGIMTGLKLGVSLSLAGAIVGEWFGDTVGLGVMLLQALYFEQVPRMWMLVIVTGLMGSVLCRRAAALRLVEAGMRRVAAPWLPVIASVAILAIAWQGATDLLGVPTYVLPSPSAIAAGAADGGTTLAWGLLTTMTETVAGFGIGAAVGLALAVTFVLLPALGAAAMPMIVAINAVPSVAFVPLALIWFGIAMASKVAMAALAVSFPVLVSTLAVLRRPEEAAVSLLRSFGAGCFGVLWRLRLPAAMPSLVTGLRVGLARGIIIVIVTEMLGTCGGVGQIIYQATAQVDSVTVWAAVLAASASSLVLYGILVAVDRRLVWWN